MTMIEKELKQKANPENYDSFRDWAKANKWLIVLSPVYLIFGLVAAILSLLAKFVGITYKEMNIFIYYFVIPISWCLIIDVLLGISIPFTSELDGTHFVTIPVSSGFWCLFWAIIIFHNRHDFRKWCERAFDNSVKFLLWFKVIGWNYYVSSVIICVVVPILVYCGLIYLCYV